MLAMGLAIDMPAKNRPALRAVLLRDPHPPATTPSLVSLYMIHDRDLIDLYAASYGINLAILPEDFH